MLARLDKLKATDTDLLNWISLGSREPRQVIVEACLPKRQVVFTRPSIGPVRPSAVRVEESAQTRAEILAELKSYLGTLLGAEPVLLSSAGALAVEADALQVARLLDHPMVKGIRLNQTLFPPGRRRQHHA